MVGMCGGYVWCVCVMCMCDVYVWHVCVVGMYPMEMLVS